MLYGYLIMFWFVVPRFDGAKQQGTDGFCNGVVCAVVVVVFAVVVVVLVLVVVFVDVCCCCCCCRRCRLLHWKTR